MWIGVCCAHIGTSSLPLLDAHVLKICAQWGSSKHFCFYMFNVSKLEASRLGLVNLTWIHSVLKNEFCEVTITAPVIYFLKMFQCTGGSFWDYILCTTVLGIHSLICWVFTWIFWQMSMISYLKTIFSVIVTQQNFKTLKFHSI